MIYRSLVFFAVFFCIGCEHETTPINTAPVVIEQYATLKEDTAIIIKLSGKDAENDPLSFEIVDMPKHGTFNGTTYTPDTNYHGTDSFRYRANDGKLYSLPAKVNLMITSVNDSPTVDVGKDINITVGERCDPQPVFNDIDGDVVKIEWKEGEEILSFPKLDFEIGRHTVTIIVTDNEGATAEDILLITVIPKAVACVPLLKTGVTNSSHPNDDGDLQRGAERTFVRDDGLNFVEVEASGLVWIDDAESNTTLRTWEEAKSYCTTVNSGGFSDWRLPRTEELSQLLDRGVSSSYHIDQKFKYKNQGGYWSGEEYGGETDSENAWVAYFSAKIINFVKKDHKLYARCVRGNASTDLPANHFIRDDSLDTVTDIKRCLMWQDSNISMTIQKDWGSAIEYCEDLNFAGYEDWHLPNITELHSITDKAERNPAISSIFSYTQDTYYWSANPVPFDEYSPGQDFAWSIHFATGSTKSGDKSFQANTRCMRVPNRKILEL